MANYHVLAGPYAPTQTDTHTQLLECTTNTSYSYTWSYYCNYEFTYDNSYVTTITDA